MTVIIPMTINVVVFTSTNTHAYTHTEQEAGRVQKWLDHEKQRDVNIQQVINAKIAAMRDNCLPEKYLREVEKQLKNIQSSRNRIR